MNDIQAVLNAAQRHMATAQQQEFSGPAGTRVLQSLVTILAKQRLSVEHQHQVHTILEMHERCIMSNGKQKRCWGPV